MRETIAPIFHVHDAEETAEWYAMLGFEVTHTHRFAPDLPLYVILRRGDAELHLSEHHGDAQPLAIAYMHVIDITPFAIASGMTPTDQPWALELTFTDPDGNRLRVGQPHDAGRRATR